MELSDAELIEEYLHGDESSFYEIVTRYTNPLYNFIARLIYDREEAHDLTQEVFVRVWKNIKSFDRQRSFKTWIFSIARNLAIDRLRKHKAIQFSDILFATDAPYEETLADTELLPDELFSRTELTQELERAFKKIHPAHVEIILLHLVEEMTFEEIGQVLGEPMNTIKTRYRRALAHLRKELSVD